MKRVPIILFGLGHVGRALLRQIVHNRSALERRLNLRLIVVGLAGRHDMLLNPAGLDDKHLMDLIERLEARQTLLLQHKGHVKPDNRTVLDALLPELDTPPVIVDATTAEKVLPDWRYALEKGCCLALANNRALVGPWSVCRRFFESPKVRFEATVCAGLPITRTLRNLLDTGDRASALEGSLSGTVGYLCSQLQLDVPFSVALRHARELGYTEPDPREDLTGQDSARKILILGRLAGWPLERRDVQVERLCSPALASLPLEQFMEEVSQLDDNMVRRGQVAKEEGCVLRYVAEIDPGGGRVGLRAMPKASQFGVLQGPECLLTLFTARYMVSPLTISGRGVGPDLAAAATLNDIICMAC